MDLSQYRLVWSDEFDYDGRPDPKKWGFEVGQDWANGELQAYVDKPENAYVRDGHLTIRALPVHEGKRNYTSARMVTYGKASWQHGYFEIRAKIPGGVGSWPALWLLPDAIMQGTHWPLCGEIDMMEHTMYHPDTLVFSLHSQKYNHTRPLAQQHSTSVFCPGAREAYHIYAMEWTEDYFEYFYDGKSVCKYCRAQTDADATSWPYEQPFFLIVNIAVGGFMGGPVCEAELPYTMELDYVRVYQKEEAQCRQN